MQSSKIIFIILALTLVAIPLQAMSIPQPQGAVNDFAHIIDPASRQEITRLINEIKTQTTVEIAVATVETLEGIPKEEYALQLAQEWGIGKKETDNGILILIAQQEREYRMEIGKGLEGTINDAKAGRIGRQILVPNFQKNQYGKGIYETILEIKGLVENNPEVIARYEEQPLNPLMIYSSLAYAVITLIITLTAFENKKINWKHEIGRAHV